MLLKSLWDQRETEASCHKCAREVTRFYSTQRMFIQLTGWLFMSQVTITLSLCCYVCLYKSRVLCISHKIFYSSHKSV
ncbi:hypothetical protein HID58_014440 [Brassica napus]|uniref:Uncharacterized protein n=1 Tax=Brassica napus TaxID=3708 RepID=A0ABQ8DHP6_BRANA|nr:hypothetical protein HID58_014440 [Brassica napus]